MEILEKKLVRQELGISKWIANKGIGTFWWYTAVGKTYASILILKRMLAKHSTAHTIIIVPSEELQKQWKREIKEHIAEIYWINVEVFTIHYLVLNNIKINTDLLIADEIHEYLTDERFRFLDKSHISYKWCLGLTATFEDREGRHKKLKEICPVVDKIDEAEALREGYISKFIEYNLSCKLSDIEEAEYRAYTNIINRELPKFARQLDIAQKCLQGGEQDGRVFSGFAFCNGWARRQGWIPNGDHNDPEWLKVDNLWNPSKIMGYAKNLMTAIRERKEIIYRAHDKSVVAVELVKKYPQLKTICFSQSTLFADKLGIMINRELVNHCVVYHSKLDTITRVNVQTGKTKKVGKTVLKREAIEAISTGKAMCISTASALDKGFNVVDIRMGITTSGTQNPTQYSQRGGRVKRLEIFNPDVVVLVVNLYVPDTVDERWLKTRQKKATNQVYWVSSISEVNYTPVDKELISGNLI